MRTFVVRLSLSLLIAGCGSKPGNGLWNLKIGADAKLVSADGADITLEALSAPAPGKAGRRPQRIIKAEQVGIPSGTEVVVLAIDGDDARIEIKAGPRAGSIYWVECARLEPVEP